MLGNLSPDLPVDRPVDLPYRIIACNLVVIGISDRISSETHLAAHSTFHHLVERFFHLVRGVPYSQKSCPAISRHNIITCKSVGRAARQDHHCVVVDQRSINSCTGRRVLPPEFNGLSDGIIIIDVLIRIIILRALRGSEERTTKKKGSRI